MPVGIFILFQTFAWLRHIMIWTEALVINQLLSIWPWRLVKKQMVEFPVKLEKTIVVWMAFIQNTGADSDNLAISIIMKVDLIITCRVVRFLPV